MDALGRVGGWVGVVPEEQFRKRGRVTMLMRRRTEVSPPWWLPPPLQLPEEVASPMLVETPILQSLGAQWAGQAVEALIWLTSLGVRRL